MKGTPRRARPVPAPASILTLEVEPSFAGALADRVRNSWGIEPVAISRPCRGPVWVEVCFKTEVQAMLAGEAGRGWKGVLAVSVRDDSRRDWESIRRRHVKSFDVGERLRICPVWDRAARGRSRRGAVVIDPGLSFGAGDHFTTRFCLEMIEKLCRARPSASLLDVGTGSGILAIAAAQLGVRKVVGLDSDGQAVAEARANARLNGLERRIRFQRKDILSGAIGGTFEVVCANLYGPLLMDSSGVLSRAASRHLILSGIREAEADGVAETFLSRGGREVVRDGNGEWVGMLFEFGVHSVDSDRPSSTMCQL
jgi:ribosomal protein L11 methyltransferase